MAKLTSNLPRRGVSRVGTTIDSGAAARGATIANETARLGANLRGAAVAQDERRRRREAKEQSARDAKAQSDAITAINRAEAEEKRARLQESATDDPAYAATSTERFQDSVEYEIPAGLSPEIESRIRGMGEAASIRNVSSAEEKQFNDTRTSAIASAELNQNQLAHDVFSDGSRLGAANAANEAILNAHGGYLSDAERKKLTLDGRQKIALGAIEGALTRGDYRGASALIADREIGGVLAPTAVNRLNAQIGAAVTREVNEYQDEVLLASQLGNNTPEQVQADFENGRINSSTRRKALINIDARDQKRFEKAGSINQYLNGPGSVSEAQRVQIERDTEQRLTERSQVLAASNGWTPDQADEWVMSVYLDAQAEFGGHLPQGARNRITSKWDSQSLEDNQTAARQYLQASSRMSFAQQEEAFGETLPWLRAASWLEESLGPGESAQRISQLKRFQDEDQDPADVVAALTARAGTADLERARSAMGNELQWFYQTNDDIPDRAAQDLLVAESIATMLFPGDPELAQSWAIANTKDDWQFVDPLTGGAPWFNLDDRAEWTKRPAGKLIRGFDKNGEFVRNQLGAQLDEKNFWAQLDRDGGIAGWTTREEVEANLFLEPVPGRENAMHFVSDAQMVVTDATTAVTRNTVQAVPRNLNGPEMRIMIRSNPDSISGGGAPLPAVDPERGGDLLYFPTWESSPEFFEYERNQQDLRAARLAYEAGGLAAVGSALVEGRTRVGFDVIGEVLGATLEVGARTAGEGFAELPFGPAALFENRPSEIRERRAKIDAATGKKP